MCEPNREPVLVSRCLLGEPCRYHGRSTMCGHKIGRSRLIARLRRRYWLIPICPEVDAGMPTPRPPTRIVDGRWLCDGRDVTDVFRRGAAIALAAAARYGARRAYLYRRSPACDPVHGMTGMVLRAAGLTVVGA